VIFLYAVQEPAVAFVHKLGTPLIWCLLIISAQQIRTFTQWATDRRRHYERFCIQEYDSHCRWYVGAVVPTQRKPGGTVSDHFSSSHRRRCDRCIESMLVAPQLTRPWAVLKAVQLVYHSFVYFMPPCPAVQTSSPGSQTANITHQSDCRIYRTLLFGITAAARGESSYTQRLLRVTALSRIEFGWACRGHGFKFAHWYGKYLWYSIYIFVQQHRHKKQTRSARFKCMLASSTFG
jgi:hypothetical protein